VGSDRFTMGKNTLRASPGKVEGVGGVNGPSASTGKKAAINLCSSSAEHELL